MMRARLSRFVPGRRKGARRGLLVVSMVVVSTLALPVLLASASAAIVYVSAFDATGAASLHEPAAVTADSRGNVYIADTAVNRIVKFDASGHSLGSFGQDSGGCGDQGHLCYPLQLTYANDHIYVADWGGNDVQVFTTEGRFVLKWGTQGVAEGDFSAVTGIAADCAGSIYVTDGRNQNVQEFDGNGKFIKRFGLGELDVPSGIAVASHGSGGACVNEGIYVSDEYDGHLAHFDGSGNFLGLIGTKGSGPLQFDHPEQLALETQPESPVVTLWVADSVNNRVEQLISNDAGASWSYAGEITSGAEKLLGPKGVAVGAQGQLYVVNSSVAQVYEYADKAPELSVYAIGNSRDRITSTEGLFFEVKYNQLNKNCNVLVKATVTVPTRPRRVFTIQKQVSVGNQTIEAKLDLSTTEVHWLEAAWQHYKVRVVARAAGACSDGVHVTKTESSYI